MDEIETSSANFVGKGSLRNWRLAEGCSNRQEDTNIKQITSSLKKSRKALKYEEEK